VWSHDTDDRTFVLSGGEVLVAGDSGGTWNAFDIASGSMRWSRHGDGSAILAVSGNFAVTDVLSVFDVTTGEHAWGTGQYQTLEHLHVVGDVVLGDSSAHKPVAYDLATGDELWTLTDGFVLTVLEQSSTVVTENDDVVELHDLRSGAVLWTLTVGDTVGVRARTDADGSLFILLDKYRKDLATIIAITPPAT
jgi:outer membrane protein assembly factor BamB